MVPRRPDPARGFGNVSHRRVVRRGTSRQGIASERSRRRGVEGGGSRRSPPPFSFAPPPRPRLAPAAFRSSLAHRERPPSQRRDDAPPALTVRPRKPPPLSPLSSSPQTRPARSRRRAVVPLGRRPIESRKGGVRRLPNGARGDARRDRVPPAGGGRPPGEGGGEAAGDRQRPDARQPRPLRLLPLPRVRRHLPREARGAHRRGARIHAGRRRKGRDRGVHGVQQERVPLFRQGPRVRRVPSGIEGDLLAQQRLRRDGGELGGMLRAELRGDAEEHGDPRVGLGGHVSRRDGGRHRVGRGRRGIFELQGAERSEREGVRRFRQAQVRPDDEGREGGVDRRGSVRRRRLGRRRDGRRGEGAREVRDAGRRGRGDDKGGGGADPRGHAVLLRPRPRLRDAEAKSSESRRCGGPGVGGGRRHDRRRRRNAQGCGIPDADPDETADVAKTRRLKSIGISSPVPTGSACDR
ncbi:hypothetical protein ACHAWF_012432 [Thalassiosira exigua]